jgi:hypothetical protein
MVGSQFALLVCSFDTRCSPICEREVCSTILGPADHRDLTEPSRSHVSPDTGGDSQQQLSNQLRISITTSSYGLAIFKRVVRQVVDDGNNAKYGSVGGALLEVVVTSGDRLRPVSLRCNFCPKGFVYGKDRIRLKIRLSFGRPTGTYLSMPL